MHLTHYQLAAKMGIPSTLILSWENGTGRPDKQQREFLMALKNLGKNENWVDYTILFPTT
jgi:DNA-binding transcriptional regulator YiaG